MRQSRNLSSSRQPRAAAAPERSEPRTSLYDEVTGRILAELAEGHLPWVQPWGLNGATCAALPRNALTLRRYSGINVLILWGAVIEGG